MTKNRVLSGIQPTGILHLGNYFGAVSNWVRLQREHECFYAIVDYHAISVPHEPEALRANTRMLAVDLLACGIDPTRATLFVQSRVPEHTELAWILSACTSFGDLQRMTQFKEKGEEARGFVSAGLFTYPILQAADILIYKADRVPVGEDQLQHLELCRDIAERFNKKFGDTFPEVKPILSEAPRLMSPADPTRKMSKSLGPKHYLGVFESDDELWKKIKTAVTDTGGADADRAKKSPGVANFFLLLKLAAEPAVLAEMEAAYAAGTLQYAKLKEATFEAVKRVIAPLRERRKSLEADPAAVERILAQGAEKARAVARRTLDEVRKKIGVD